MSKVLTAPNTNTELDPKLREGAKQVYKVRLLRGRHADREGKWDPDEENKSFAPGDPKRNGRNSVRVFQANRAKGVMPEFETVTDLTGPAYNPPGYPPKFELVQGQTQVQVDSAQRRSGESLAAYIQRMNEMMAAEKSRSEQNLKGLDSMSMDKLRELAEAEEIDYTECRTVEDFRKTIRAALAPTTPSKSDKK